MNHINCMIWQKCLKFIKNLYRAFLVMFLGIIFNALCSRINYKTLQDYMIMHKIRKLLEGLQSWFLIVPASPKFTQRPQRALNVAKIKKNIKPLARELNPGLPGERQQLSPLNHDSFLLFWNENAITCIEFNFNIFVHPYITLLHCANDLSDLTRVSNES